MRMIDADKLKKSIPKTEVDIFENCRYCTLLSDEQVLEMINKQPIVKERKKGKWVNDQNDYYANCSECGYQMDTHTERGYFNFCPNCGADMRGERKEE